MNVDRMLREELSSKQISEWMAYASIEPFGAQAWRGWSAKLAGEVINQLVYGIASHITRLMRFGPVRKAEEEPAMVPYTGSSFRALKAALQPKGSKDHGRS